uniref:Retinoic acid induced 14 n=1 Tax=Neolamprologus brichardi TaxID=32507 RepID=A0A3Q4GBL1_NEOBR
MKNLKKCPEMEHGEVEKVSSLLAKKGANPVKLDSEGKSAFYVLKIDCLSFILAHGADLSVTDAAGFSPLHLAAKNNHTECCRKLIQVNHFVFSFLCLPQQISVVEVLVKRGADLSTVDAEGHEVLHYAKVSGSSETKTALSAALNKHPVSGKSCHDQVAKISDERIITPKKRKAPPPPISPPQVNACVSFFLPLVTPFSSPFFSQEDEIRGTALKEEVDKERNMLLETIEDLKQTVETVTGPEMGGKKDTKLDFLYFQPHSLSFTFACSLIPQKHPSLQGNENLKEMSRPNSIASNSSFHSTQDEFESLPQVPSTTQVEGEDPGADSVILEEEEREKLRGGGEEEIRLLRQTLEKVQKKLLETRKENQSLQAQLNDRGRERELMESLADLQAKLTDTQERYHQAVEEVENLRVQVGTREGQDSQRLTSSTLEHEVTQLKAQLTQSESEVDKATQHFKRLEEALKKTEEDRESAKQKEQRAAQLEELYKEAQEEVRVLQEALKGTVPVESAAKDFEEMKAARDEEITGLQLRCRELSRSYSETKNQLNATQKQLAEAQAEKSTAPSPTLEQQVQVLNSKVEELQRLLAEAEKKYSSAQEEISLLRKAAEVQAQNSVALADQMQVMSSLGNAIKELENEVEALKEELHQKTTQVEALQHRLTAEKDVTPDDSVSRVEHDTVREQLEGEVNHLTHLLQEALRKQDEMALEAADAWQKARDNGAEREALQELVMSKEKENQTLTSKLAESQDAVCQLKQLVENHTASEREKNKRIDDLSREVVKLKDALNSLSQLSYSSCSPSKRQQQNQQLETMQQQIKQLQYQLAESKKQHSEVVSVYRMHLLYAVQGQMDEDVQKALKQILMMCKMPSQANEAS